MGKGKWQLAAIAEQEAESFGEMLRFSMTEDTDYLPVEQIKTGKGKSATFEISVKERGIPSSHELIIRRLQKQIV